jgi:predicted unusual protein kinase regulating ubiquinone biosynthesis (AarF/ABC1/UbiB family)
LPDSSGPEVHIAPVAFSTLTHLRNNLLSWFVPVKLAVAISDLVTPPTAEQGVFKRFVEELKTGLNVTGGSPEFIAQLVPEYLKTTLNSKMSAGELLEFKDKIENDLKCAYDDSTPLSTQKKYKTRAFKTIMLQLGPHGLKYIQSMRPKDPNSWLSEAITTAQSDLPAVPITEVERMLKDAFRAQGSVHYSDHFSDHFQVLKVLGAGVVGIAAAISFKETPTAKEQELVVKIIRPGIVKHFITDNENLNRAVAVLLAQKKATSQEAASFRYLSEKKLAEELKEANPTVEIAQLEERPYQGPGVATVRGNLDLAGKASNVVFMEKAPGIELGKYLKKTRQMLADTQLPPSERDSLLEDIALVRQRYVTLTRIHLDRINRNLSVHADPHPGNIFYIKGLLSVLDLGAEVRPRSPEAHRQLQQFLFSVYLSVGTADTHYLRMFYEQYNKNPIEGTEKINPMKIERLITSIQEQLNTIKQKSREKNVIDTDKALSEIMGIIANAAITSGPELIPSALVSLGRSNSLLADELEELRNDLSGSRFAKNISYTERTLLGIALKSALTQGKTKNASLWTAEEWAYFKKNCLAVGGGVEQLKFEKKFIYGIFGLNENEAKMADFILPAAVVTGPMAVFFGTRALARTIKTASIKLPEFFHSYKFIDTIKQRMSGEELSMKEFLSKVNSIFSQKKNWEVFTQKFRTTLFTGAVKRTPAPIIPPRPSYQPRFFMSPTMRKSIPGLIVGGVLAYGAKKLYDYSHAQKPDASDLYPKR